MLSVRLPEDIERRLTALAETTGRPKSFYVFHRIRICQVQFGQGLRQRYGTGTTGANILQTLFGPCWANGCKVSASPA